MRIRYSPQAREDLEQIRRYIGGVLKNPDAARRVTAGIVADARKLSAQPMLGVSLQEFFSPEINDPQLVNELYHLSRTLDAEDLQVLIDTAKRLNKKNQ